MAPTWNTRAVSEVRAGDRIQLPTGDEMQVARVESPFLGTDALVCLIEDSDVRWFAQPLPVTMEVQVLQAS